MGAGLKVIVRSRPALAANGGGSKLTFAVPLAADASEAPTKAVKGDLLVVLAVRGGTAVVAPAGWTQLENGLGGADPRLDAWARLVDDNEPPAPVFTCAAQFELQGQLIVIRGGTPGPVRESSNHVAFAADINPDTPDVSSEQAANLLVFAWSSSGAIDFDRHADYTAIDEYSSAVFAARTILLGYKIAKAIGTAIAQPDCQDKDAATGRSFALTLRELVPPAPPELVDLVPGNIGLLP